MSNITKDDRVEDLVRRLYQHGSSLSMEAAGLIESQAVDLAALAATAAQNITERQAIEVQLLNQRAKR